MEDKKTELERLKAELAKELEKKKQRQAAEDIRKLSRLF